MIGGLRESVESIGLVSWTEPVILVTIVVTVTLVGAIVFMLYLAFGIETEDEEFGPTLEESRERLERSSGSTDQRRDDYGGAGLDTDEPTDRTDGEVSEESTEERSSEPTGE